LNVRHGLQHQFYDRDSSVVPVSFVRHSRPVGLMRAGYAALAVLGGAPLATPTSTSSGPWEVRGVASSESSGGAGDRVGAGHGGVPGQRDPAAGRRGRNAGRPPGPAGRGPRAQRCGPPPPLPVGPGARLTGWSGWWGEGAAGRRGGLRHRGAPVVAGDEHDPRSWAAAGAAGRGGRRPAGDPARAGGRGAGGRSRRLAGGRRRCRRAGVVPGRPAAGGWAATRAAARGRVRGRRHGRSW